ncbi:MAG: hypothetical protein K6B16_01615 [Bacteroidales bacterium]|nr:hypothetical protein [Bacteroidales bacterium]
MKRLSFILSVMVLGLLTALDAAGQAQVYTRKEKLKDFTAKTTKVVLSGEEFLDEALKESVASTWTLSPYEFCTNEEFQKLKTSDNFYFLIVASSRQKKEEEPGLDMLTLVKGGEGASKSIDGMLEVVSFPFRAARFPSGREFTLLPAFLQIIQNHVSTLADTEMKAYSNLSAKDTKKLKTKRIYFWEEDLSKQIGSHVRESLDEDIIIEEDDEDVDKVFDAGEVNTVVSYVVAPDVPVDGSVCYKMLIGSDTLELYYFKKHKITSKNGKGFLASDLKAIKSIRKR